MEQIIEELSTLVHEKWRDLTYPNEPNKEHLRPEFKIDGDKLININIPYNELNYVWKKTNNNAVNIAILAYTKFPDNREKAASFIHDEWMNNNDYLQTNTKYSHLFVSYNKLNEVEKEKDAIQYDIIKNKVETNVITLEQINNYLLS